MIDGIAPYTITAGEQAAVEGHHLDDMVTRYAALPAEAAEPMIDAHARQAVAEWRITDATFWQRVKYRARLVRAVARRKVTNHAAGRQPR